MVYCYGMVDFREFIEVNPNVRFGKPVLKGTRIAVVDVVEWLADGMTFEEILSDFPELSSEQIRACLAYSESREWS